MSEGRVERRLAAILAADVAGYSPLIGENEEGTLGTLRAMRREVIDPTISAYWIDDVIEDVYPRLSV